MAANRSPLAQRVLRLLGLDGSANKMRVAGLAVGIACLAGALLAGDAFLGVAHAALGSATPAKQDQQSGSVIVVRPESAKRSGLLAKPGKDVDKEKDKAAEKEIEEDQQQANESANKKESSYLEAMEAAGFKNLSADELIAM